MYVISKEKYDALEEAAAGGGGSNPSPEHRQLIDSVAGDVSGGQVNHIEIGEGGRVVIKPNALSASGQKPKRTRINASNQDRDDLEDGEVVFIDEPSVDVPPNFGDIGASPPAFPRSETGYKDGGQRGGVSTATQTEANTLSGVSKFTQSEETNEVSKPSTASRGLQVQFAGPKRFSRDTQTEGVVNLQSRDTQTDVGDRATVNTSTQTEQHSGRAKPAYVSVSRDTQTEKLSNEAREGYASVSRDTQTTKERKPGVKFRGVQTDFPPSVSRDAQTQYEGQEKESERMEGEEMEIQADFFVPSQVFSGKVKGKPRGKSVPYSTRSTKRAASKDTQEIKLKDIIHQRLQKIGLEVPARKVPVEKKRLPLKVSFADDKETPQVSLSNPPKRGRKKLIPLMPPATYSGKKPRGEKMQNLIRRRLQTLTGSQPKGGVKRKRTSQDSAKIPPGKRGKKEKTPTPVRAKRKRTGKDEHILPPSKRNKKEEHLRNFAIMT